MKLNNAYNFKNPVKHFLDVDSLKFPDDVSSMDIKKLSWVEPFSFRVKKQGDKYRTLKMPNILNFACAYEQFKSLPNFDNVKMLDFSHKRLSTNIETGDFISGEYEKQLEEDFERLCVYDNLIRMDIKEYYGRIYTHHIDFKDKKENYLSNLNLGGTNGLLMGNYLSLYFAETILKSISDDIEQEIINAEIECDFSYFSDDFYFFCNKNDNEKVVKIFDKVLEKYHFERNESKKEVWDYETYNNYNLVARYWKKLIAYCNIRFNEERDNNKLYFINQLVYRMSKLEDDKLKTVFINNFFKTRYFMELDLEKYQIRRYDYHQLCFIMKFSPEVMVYAVKKFSTMSDFDSRKLYKFFKVRYREALQESFNEEQLYYYYAIKMFNFTDILEGMKDVVFKSNNQILISYYLKDGIFNDKDKEVLKENTDEKFWFQNYHLILYSDSLLNDLENSIRKYLIPTKADKERKKESYMNFYKENLGMRNSIIRDFGRVDNAIQKYLLLRIEEGEAAFEEREDEEIII
ncbi:hypothetical protein O0550_12125 [Brevibacillus halotolerans]|uniref:hypothetical protein n=1 Tax=Brevibacillus TaxID=55080 RepID=UPI00215C2435|nr:MULTISPECIES: hypothetical protein [Brevibacillus]MCR8963941.1 hypothetical protein [Brevibacillus laterosporus]MCZ0836096.1 hypothetical protein [Brevibacillus halotolerans]